MKRKVVRRERGERMIYLVIAMTIADGTIQKQFRTYREALCYATDYRHIRSSRILKHQNVLADFSY